MSKKLQFQGEKSPSVGPKVAIISWYLLCAAGAAWLAFTTPMGSNRPGDPGRQVALLACVIIYVARAAHTLFVFVKRKVPWWEAAWGGSIIGCVLFFFLLGGLRAPQPIGPIDVPLAMGLNFALVIIPAHDAYLAARYGGEFDRYARRTSKLVPLLY